MSNSRESFVFYRSFYDALKTCESDVRLSVLNSIFVYMFEEDSMIENMVLDGMSNTIFTLIKPQLDSLKKKYNAGVQNRLRIKEHRPSKKTNHDILMIEKISKVLERNITRDITSTSNVNVNDNVNDNVNVDVDRYDFVIDKIAPKEKKKKIFIVPTMEQWLEYFRENGYREDVGIRAFKSYQVAGWKDSRGNKIKNWKQKLQQVWFTDNNKIQSSNKTENEVYTMPSQYRPFNQSK
jgi:hypothetical protein